MGTIINMADANVRTPEQVLRVFFMMYRTADVRLGLWKAFGAVTQHPKPLSGDAQVDLDEMAELFDQLMALVNALDLLKDDPPGHCPVCGRRGGNETPEG